MYKSIRNFVLFGFLFISCSSSKLLHSEYLLNKWYLNAVRPESASDTVRLLDCSFFYFRENERLDAFNSLRNSTGHWKLEGKKITLTHNLANGDVEKLSFRVDELTSDKLVMTDLDKKVILYLSRECERE